MLGKEDRGWLAWSRHEHRRAWRQPGQLEEQAWVPTCSRCFSCPRRRREKPFWVWGSSALHPPASLSPATWPNGKGIGAESVGLVA